MNAKYWYITSYLQR